MMQSACYSLFGGHIN